MVHQPDTDAAALLEQLGALGIAGARVDADDLLVVANHLFFELTGLLPQGAVGQKLNDVLESSAAEHKAYGEGRSIASSRRAASAGCDRAGGAASPKALRL